MSSITLALVQIKCYTNYMEKEKFYIFLDIDGTLYTQQDIRERTPAGFPMYISEDFWPQNCNAESRDSFNKIIDTLEQKYDTEVVIVSRKRKDMQMCEHYLKEVYKLHISKPLQKTPYIDGERSDKIINYIENDCGLYPKTRNIIKNLLNRKKLTTNYVIIDDDTFAKDMRTTLLSNIFGEENYIHVHGKRSSLRMSQADEFLKSKNLIPDDLLPN